MPARHFIVATAGHPGHGKSALVRALTGSDPDRFPEAKAPGVTIDPGYSRMELPDRAGGTGDVFSLGLVDLPGPEDLVKDRGADLAELGLALLVVAADDGWMPQTEEHVQLLTYLGVTRAVVALTQADLLVGRQVAVVEAVRARLTGTPFADAPVIPTPVVAGHGCEELKAALASVLATTPPPADVGKPRLAVDRVFNSQGGGTVVVGTLAGGTFRRGQAVVVQPAGRPTRVRGLQSHGIDLETSVPGQRVGLNLSDIAPRSEGTAAGVGRGDTLSFPGLGRAADAADVLLVRSARLAGLKTPAARPLADRARVRVYFGCAGVAATVFLHGGGALLAGQEVLAQLRFENPVYRFGGDRFIVLDQDGEAILAGGFVLDPDGHRKHWQHRAQRALLEARAAAPADPAVWVASQLARDGVVARAGLLAKTQFSAATVASALSALAGEKRAVPAGELAADAGRWREWLERAAEAVDLAHRAHPEWVGLPLAELEAPFEEELGLPGAFEALTEALCLAGFVQDGTTIRRATHRPALPPRLEAAGNWLRQTLAEKPLEPPARKELVGDRASHEALRFLLETGEAVAVGPDLVLTAGAYSQAVSRVKAVLCQRGPATVSELRQALGCTRRLMVPLCEKLDHEGLTHREGDVRRWAGVAEPPYRPGS